MLLTMWERLQTWWRMGRMPQRAVVPQLALDGRKSARRWACAVQGWFGLLAALAVVQAVACWRVRTHVDDRPAFDVATTWTYPMFAVQLGTFVAGCYALQFWRDRLRENAREVPDAQVVALAPLGRLAWDRFERDGRRTARYPGWWPLVPLVPVAPLGFFAAWALDASELEDDFASHRARLVAGFGCVAVLAGIVAVACVLTIVVVRRIDDRAVFEFDDTVTDGSRSMRAPDQWARG